MSYDNFVKYRTIESIENVIEYLNNNYVKELSEVESDDLLNKLRELKNILFTK